MPVLTASSSPFVVSLHGRDQYHRMIDANIVAEEDHVEMIDGELFKMRVIVDGLSAPYRFSPEQVRSLIKNGIVTEDEADELPVGENPSDMSRKPPHDCTLDLVMEALRDVLPKGWRCRGQSAVTLKTGEPEPDLAVVQGSARDFYTRHPVPGDIAIVIEVSYRTLKNDRTRKLRTYARNGISIYWIVNVKGRQIEVYTNPITPPSGEPFYGTRTDYKPGQKVPVMIAGAEVGRVLVSNLAI